MKIKQKYILWSLIFLPYLLLFFAGIWYVKVLNNIDNASFVIISKQEMKLYNYDYKGNLLQESKIACGKNFGNKDSIGDKRTPEGVFNVASIEDSKNWKHDFADGKGQVGGAYGPYFIRLNVPNQKGIGIHGTHLPNSIGLRTTEGCIRLDNNDVLKLIKRIKSKTVVVITPSEKDIKFNH